MTKRQLGHLRQATEKFAQAISGRTARKSGKGDQTDAIRRALKQGTKAVQLLDVIVPNVFGLESAMTAKWKRERRVEIVGSTSASDKVEPAQTPAPASEAA